MGKRNTTKNTAETSKSVKKSKNKEILEEPEVIELVDEVLDTEDTKAVLKKVFNSKPKASPVDYIPELERDAEEFNFED